MTFNLLLLSLNFDTYRILYQLSLFKPFFRKLDVFSAFMRYMICFSILHLAERLQQSDGLARAHHQPLPLLLKYRRSSPKISGSRERKALFTEKAPQQAAFEVPLKRRNVFSAFIYWTTSSPNKNQTFLTYFKQRPSGLERPFSLAFNMNFEKIVQCFLILMYMKRTLESLKKVS